jgi:hypothetical protein
VAILATHPRKQEKINKDKSEPGEPVIQNDIGGHPRDSFHGLRWREWTSQEKLTARTVSSYPKAHERENGLPMVTKYGLDEHRFRVEEDKKVPRPGFIITAKKFREIGFPEFDRRANNCKIKWDPKGTGILNTRRTDPDLKGRSVTFEEMRQAYTDANQGLDEAQLKEHWANLQPASRDNSQTSH